MWDVARANKAPFAFGIEPRVPFLDKAFLQTSMSIDPQDKMVRKRLSSSLSCHFLFYNFWWEVMQKRDAVVAASHFITTAIVLLV